MVQGKTLSHVTADITVKKEGIAYVAVSRARTWHGLAITKEVTSLAQLNHPLPKDLLNETRQLEALLHNTLVQKGFLDNGILVEVPDPEKEDGQEVHIIRLDVEEPKSHIGDRPLDKSILNIHHYHPRHLSCVILVIANIYHNE